MNNQVKKVLECVYLSNSNIVLWNEEIGELPKVKIYVFALTTDADTLILKFVIEYLRENENIYETVLVFSYRV